MTKKAARTHGFIGLFGHTLCLDEEQTRIQFQFQIIRTLPGKRYLIQYFSFLDGSPTNLGALAEEELLDEKKLKLYQTDQDMNWAYEKHERLWRHRRRWHKLKPEDDFEEPEFMSLAEDPTIQQGNPEK